MGIESSKETSGSGACDGCSTSSAMTKLFYLTRASVLPAFAVVDSVDELRVKLIESQRSGIDYRIVFEPEIYNRITSVRDIRKYLRLLNCILSAQPTTEMMATAQHCLKAISKNKTNDTYNEAVALCLNRSNIGNLAVQPQSWHKAMIHYVTPGVLMEPSIFSGIHPNLQNAVRNINVKDRAVESNAIRN